MKKKTSPLITFFAIFILIVAFSAAIVAVLVALDVIDLNFIFHDKKEESSNNTNVNISSLNESRGYLTTNDLQNVTELYNSTETHGELHHNLTSGNTSNAENGTMNSSATNTSTSTINIPSNTKSAITITTPSNTTKAPSTLKPSETNGEASKVSNVAIPTSTQRPEKSKLPFVFPVFPPESKINESKIDEIEITAIVVWDETVPEWNPQDFLQDSQNILVPGFVIPSYDYEKLGDNSPPNSLFPGYSEYSDFADQSIPFPQDTYISDYTFPYIDSSPFVGTNDMSDIFNDYHQPYGDDDDDDDDDEDDDDDNDNEDENDDEDD